MSTASISLPGSRLPTDACAIERVGAVDRRGDQRFLEREAHAEAGERHRERHRRREAAAGIDVGRQRDRHAGVDQRARRREASQLEVEGGVRQQRGDDARVAPARGCRPRGRRSGDRPIARRPRRRPAIRRSRRARRRGCAASGRAPRRPARIRVDSSGVNTPVSQKTSHHSARPSAATAGIISSITRRT